MDVLKRVVVLFGYPTGPLFSFLNVDETFNQVQKSKQNKEIEHVFK